MTIVYFIMMAPLALLFIGLISVTFYNAIRKAFVEGDATELIALGVIAAIIFFIAGMFGLMEEYKVKAVVPVQMVENE